MYVVYELPFSVWLVESGADFFHSWVLRRLNTEYLKNRLSENTELENPNLNYNPLNRVECCKMLEGKKPWYKFHIRIQHSFKEFPGLAYKLFIACMVRVVYFISKCI